MCKLIIAKWKKKNKVIHDSKKKVSDWKYSENIKRYARWNLKLCVDRLEKGLFMEGDKTYQNPKPYGTDISKNVT